MIRANRAGGFFRSQRGTGTIEFVVSLPLFLVALAFAYEFGQFLLTHQNVVNNVHVAARYLSRTACLDVHQERATNLIKTGQLDESDSPLPMSIGPVGGFCQFDGAGVPVRVRIDVLVNFPLSIFGLTGDARPSIPFRVMEDLPVAGM